MSLVLLGSTSGSVTLQEPAVAGSSVLSLPAVTDTVAGIAATQTLTNKTLTSPTLTTPVASTTIGVGGATASASGAGITFPATQSASTDANTLDDYEEGIFTPVLRFGGNSVGITYTVQQGRYTKIGNMVAVTVSIRLSSKGSSTGIATISGLPFTSSSSDVQFFGGSNGNLANGSGFTSFVAPTVSAGQSTVDLRMLNANSGSATGDADITNTNITNSLVFGCTITYGV